MAPTKLPPSSVGYETQRQLWFYDKMSVALALPQVPIKPAAQCCYMPSARGARPDSDCTGGGPLRRRGEEDSESLGPNVPCRVPSAAWSLTLASPRRPGGIHRPPAASGASTARRSRARLENGPGLAPSRREAAQAAPAGPVFVLSDQGQGHRTALFTRGSHSVRPCYRGFTCTLATGCL